MSPFNRRDEQERPGRPARRSVRRWAWRLLRRDWRSHGLVLALLTAAVAVAVVGTTIAAVVAGTGARASLGDASHVLEFHDPAPAELSGDLAAARRHFDQVEPIERVHEPLPGVFDPLELRHHEARGPLSAPMLDLLEGRLPAAAGELAVTDGAADLLDVELGSATALAGRSWEVVGVVENPAALGDEFALVQELPRPPDRVTLLVEGTRADLDGFRPPSGAAVTTTSAAGSGATAGAVVALGTVLLGLVALIAAAAFAVVARRRMRQLGLFAAVGATRDQVQRVLVVNGATTGVVAAVAGTTAGVVAWLVAAPGLEDVVNQRLDRLAAPWPLLAAIGLLAVGMATLSAWWPAREVARTPIVAALSGRPTPPRPVRTSVGAGLVLLAVGPLLLALADDPRNSVADLVKLAVGVMTVAAGTVVLGPSAISILDRVARRARVAVRLSLRDLERYRSRSGAALAAITLTTGMAVAVVVTASAAVYAADEGNLDANQLMVRLGDIPPVDDIRPVPPRGEGLVTELETVVGDMAAHLGDAHTTPVDVAVVPDTEGFDGLPTPVLTRPVDLDEQLFRAIDLIHVATPEVLDIHGLAPDEVANSSGFMTTASGEVWLESLTESPERLDPLLLDPTFTSLPTTLVTEAELERRGWHTARSGWFLEAARPISPDELEVARSMAADAGITVEARHDQANLAGLRTQATILGMLVSLAIVGLTVGLIRTEAARDVSILVATGATRRIRRTLTAATAGGLAGLGAVLGTVGAYLTVAALRSSQLASLLPVPLAHVALVSVGIPVLATLAAWLLTAGHTPTATPAR